MPDVFVEIESLAPGGDAVGKQRDPEGAAGAADGRVTFVPLAAPGERVRARIERAKEKVAWAELIEIERPGPDRVAPPCPLFGACGGCQWQHVSAEAQQAAKKAIVERALGIEIPPVIAASPPYGYRERARLVVGAGGTLGFRARKSHDIVDVGACPLFGAELGRALPALRALARGLAAGVELEVQVGKEGAVLNVVRADPTSAAHARREFDRLNAAGIVGVALGGKPTLGRAEVDVAEDASAPLSVAAGGFAQVGRTANAALVAAVVEAVGGSPGVVMELYAGSGNFTRHLLYAGPSTGPAPPATSSGGQSPPSLTRSGVYASDADPAAVERGRRNAPGATWSLRPPSGITPDTVVLDPPREGADRNNLAVAARARRCVVYVSCDPQTLGRDSRALQAAGLRLIRAVALDLMPQTFHVEVVATFQSG